jgi:hypothetical protein
MEETHMKRTALVLATVAVLGAAAVTAPSSAEARGIGPGLAFGLAAGAIGAGIAASTYPYGYGYYGPRYYGPAYYGPAPTRITAGRFIATATGGIGTIGKTR